MHYDITNQVTNSNTLFFKNYKKAFFHIKLTRKIKKIELVTQVGMS